MPRWVRWRRSITSPRDASSAMASARWHLWPPTPAKMGERRIAASSLFRSSCATATLASRCRTQIRPAMGSVRPEAAPQARPLNFRLADTRLLARAATQVHAATALLLRVDRPQELIYLCVSLIALWLVVRKEVNVLQLELRKQPVDVEIVELTRNGRRLDDVNA